MIAELQHPDTICSVSFLPITNHRHNNYHANSTSTFLHYRNSIQPSHDWRCIAVRNKPVSSTHKVFNNPLTRSGVTQISIQISTDHSIKKVHTKYSTKGLSYGGCIPSILGALDRISDLDEALRPWEETLSKKEGSIILNMQTNWERALQIFEWFKGKRPREANAIHYNIMLRVLGKAHKWKHIERLWCEMTKKGVAPINSTYGTLIDVYSKGGRNREAIQWLERMNEQGMEADEVTKAIAIQAYKKSGDFKKADDFFKTVSVNGNGRSIYTYNIMIDTYGKAGKLEEVWKTFARIFREGVLPNTATFNTIIHTCGSRACLKEVASLVQKMDDLGIRRDTRTYNILISLYAKGGDIRSAANCFSKMKEALLEPDIVSFRTLLCAFSKQRMVSEAEDLVSEMDEKGLEIDEFTHSSLTRMYIESEMLQNSWIWFQRFHLRGRMSFEWYAAIIDAYGERGHVLEAEKAFIDAGRNHKLTVLEYNVMIKAYGMSKEKEKACQLFDCMLNNNGVAPDKCSYNTLIQILTTADLPHLAKPYVRRMLESGLVKDCVAHCALISSFAKLGQMEMAEETYEEMFRFGVQPDVIVFGVLINAYAESGSVEEASRYVDLMNKFGIHRNDVITNSLIKLYTKVGYLKEAQEVYDRSDAVTTYSSNCMIDLYSERSMVKQAEAIFERLREKDEANEFSFAMMLCMYRRLGWFKEANTIALEMKRLGVLTELLSYNNVIAMYAADGRFSEAIQMFQEMLDMSVRPDDATFKCLGLVLMKCGVPKAVVREIETKRKTDDRNGLQEWISILSACTSH